MKKYLLILIAIVSCSKENDNNPFIHEQTYTVINKTINSLKNDKLTAKDSIYYLFERNDSLIIVSLDKEKFKVTTNAQKKGYFKIDRNKIVVTKETNPQYDILKLKKKINPFYTKVDINDNFKPDYLKGMIYKVSNQNSKITFTNIYTGDLTIVFKGKKEYTIPVVNE